MTTILGVFPARLWQSVGFKTVSETSLYDRRCKVFENKTNLQETERAKRAKASGREKLRTAG